VTLKTFLSAGHCTLFKVWGCWMHDYKGHTKYHIWLKCTPSVSACPPCIPFYFIVPQTNPVDHQPILSIWPVWTMK
jgi:hypothetical protein